MEDGYDSDDCEHKPEPKLVYQHEEDDTPLRGAQTDRPGTLKALIVITNAIKDSKLLALNLLNNCLGTAGAQAVAEALTSNVSYWCLIRCSNIG
jgi:hypothetical protein